MTVKIKKKKKKTLQNTYPGSNMLQLGYMPPLYVPGALLPSGAPEALFTAAVLRLLTQLSAFHCSHMPAHMVGAHH